MSKQKKPFNLADFFGQEIEIVAGQMRAATAHMPRAMYDQLQREVETSRKLRWGDAWIQMLSVIAVCTGKEKWGVTIAFMGIESAEKDAIRTVAGISIPNGGGMDEELIHDIVGAMAGVPADKRSIMLLAATYAATEQLFRDMKLRGEKTPASTGDFTPEHWAAYRKYMFESFDRQKAEWMKKGFISWQN